MAYTSSRRLCYCLSNRKASILMAVIDIICAIAGLIFHSVRLADLNKYINEGGSFVFYLFENDVNDYPGSLAKSNYATFYKYSIVGSVVYIFVSLLLLYGAYKRSTLFCKMWLVAIGVLFIISVIFYCLLYLTPSSLSVILITFGLLYKIWELVVVVYFINYANNTGFTIDINNVDIDANNVNSTDLDYVYSQMYMTMTPNVAVTQGLNFDPNLVNSYAYQPAFNIQNQSGNPSCVYIGVQQPNTMQNLGMQSVGNSRMNFY